VREEDQKLQALNALINDLDDVKWILIKCGVNPKRIHNLQQMLVKLPELHVNKIKSSHTWFKGYVQTFIRPWKTIRSENTEAIWDGYEKSGFGNEFPEIKELNRCSRAVKLNWDNRHNILLKEKQRKKTDEQQVKSKTDVQS
jgi:hypothetical protein